MLKIQSINKKQRHRNRKINPGSHFCRERKSASKIQKLGKQFKAIGLTEGYGKQTQVKIEFPHRGKNCRAKVEIESIKIGE